MSPARATTLTAADWETWAHRNLAVHDGGLELATEPTLRAERVALPAVDLAVGAGGTRYSLDADGVVRSYDGRRSTTRRLWEPADGGVDEPRAIAVDGDRLAVLGADGAVTVVSIRRRQAIDTTQAGVDDPMTIAPVDDGWLLLDAAGAVRLLRTDGRTETHWEGFAKPLDMTTTAAGDCYVLDERTERRRIRKQAASGDHLDGRIPTGRRRVLHKRTADGEVDPDPFPLSNFETADGESFVPNRVATAAAVDTPVWLAGSAGDRSAVAAADPETGRVDVRHRLDGSCRLLRAPAVDAGTIYAVAGGDLIRLEPVERRRRDADGAYRGVAYRQFDAGESVQWHRLALGPEPAGTNTRLRVSYLATDDPAPLSTDLTDVTGLEEPPDTVWELLAMEPAALAARTDGLSEAAAADAIDAGFAAVGDALDDQWRTVDAPTDALFESATGRYLVVRLELVGSERASPRVDSLRVSWPRQSSIESLPELYREDSGSKAFLERFLSVFDTAFDDLEADADSLTSHLDPAAAPAESLPWLADWLGVDPPVDWPTAATRELLSAAPELSRQRGTAAGLRRLLGIYLRHLPAPETPPGDRLVPGEAAAGGDDALAGVDHGLCLLEPRDLDGTAPVARAAYERHLPSQRSVAVYAGPFDDPAHRTAVETIVREETPAHVEASVVDLDPTFRLGGDSFLGCNSRLGERRLELGSTSLGHTAVLD
ncbi:phage tail protein [Halohasta salina]|uniref:phage tail protein n=1 Tax=Halohasta salina TaxID=2961621 RepID=UPI0020A4C988|nr:phage tail protein [Halohasta salina]